MSRSCLPDAFPIHNLPDELLSLILSCLKRVGPQNLATALRVCKKWHGLGEDLLWRNVVLKPRNVTQFVTCFNSRSSSVLGQRLTTLTLHFPSDSGGMPQSFYVPNAMMRLVKALPEIHCLKTVSVQQDLDCDNPWSDTGLDIPSLMRFVKHLPPSVENLEIEAPSIYNFNISYDWSDTIDEECLCAIISSRLQGLRSLRLVYPRICPKLFQCPSTTVQYIAIKATKPDLQPYMRECFLADVQTNMSWDDLQSQKTSSSRQAIEAVLKLIRCPEFTSTSLPNLQQLRVIEPYCFTEHAFGQWFLLNVHTAGREDSKEALDAGRLVTTAYPIWATSLIGRRMADSRRFIIRRFILRRCVHQQGEGHECRLEHECSVSDVMGSSGAICDALEDAAGWFTDGNTCRRPRYLSTSRIRNTFSDSTCDDKSAWEFKYGVCSLKHLKLFYVNDQPNWQPDARICQDLTGLQAFTREFGVKLKEAGADFLWYVEKQFGCNLLCAREFTQGLPEDLDETGRQHFCPAIDTVLECQKYLFSSEFVEDPPYAWEQDFLWRQEPC